MPVNIDFARKILPHARAGSDKVRDLRVAESYIEIRIMRFYLLKIAEFSLFTLMMCALFAQAQAQAQAQAELPSEKQKITALIQHVETMPDAQFVRNGMAYKAQTAGQFLRGKWERQQAEIHTAKDFIDKVASTSSTSGKPYLIRFKEREMKCGEYLMQVLKQIEKPATGNSPARQ